jgi:hypothetical protein
MRLLIREGQSAELARSVLQDIAASPQHEFWPDNASHHDIPVAGIIGHRQGASPAIWSLPDGVWVAMIFSAGRVCIGR